MKWAYLTWFPEYGADKLDPPSRSLFEPCVQGLVVQVVALVNGWASVRFADQKGKVDSSLLTECAVPRFNYGQKVKTVAPRSTAEGVIRAITWHFEKSQPYYVIATTSEKASKSRYWAHELAAA